MQCKYHSQAIIKIQQPSLRPLCQKCINETQPQKKFRLQSMRASLNKDFNSTVKQLQAQKIKLDKLIQLFVGKNMTQAKKMINKKSLQAQKIIQTSIQRQVKRANEQLKKFTDELMKPYKELQNRKQLQEIHLDFDQDFLQIEQKVQNRKRQLKRQVIEGIKQQMVNFYSQLFDF